jgi:hypothetical protein
MFIIKLLSVYLIYKVIYTKNKINSNKSDK